MELTGQCKKDFEKWFIEETKYGRNLLGKICVYIDNMLIDFNKLPFSMQYGVYVDFFDSVDIGIDVIYRSPVEAFVFYIRHDIFSESEIYNTRHEAREQAIKQANKIYNEKHND